MHVRYSQPSNLDFILPMSEPEDGSIAPEAMISGTLRQGLDPLPHATICVLEEATGKSVKCVQTTELGEYAIAVPPAIYEVEIRMSRGGEIHPLFHQFPTPMPGSEHRMRLDASSSGDYRNVLSFSDDDPQK